MSGTPLSRWAAQWLFVSFRGERVCEKERRMAEEGCWFQMYIIYRLFRSLHLIKFIEFRMNLSFTINIFTSLAYFVEPLYK